MKHITIKILIGVGIILGSFMNCANGPVGGFIYTGTEFPGEFNTLNNVASTKKAEGCTKSVLGLFTWGDSGVGQIALANKITKIATIDHSTMSVLTLVYRDYCTIVTGE
ncbi:TRL-like family protein [Leptospira semungkisensis]|uniref:TRL-like family protein n=1 Tax=Leptospira semungkisensis TaxID=2484985 RepID=A0A4V3JAT8_9LEPT|nr:TRL-like family protein [Leptospira semungkisensis]TGJ99788.1 TRL-like family protein [Leptospira semungkisensis]